MVQQISRNVKPYISHNTYYKCYSYYHVCRLYTYGGSLGPSCYRPIVLSCYRVIVLSCYRVIVLSCYRVIVLSYVRVIVLSYVRVIVCSCYRRKLNNSPTNVDVACVCLVPCPQLSCVSGLSVCHG